MMPNKRLNLSVEIHWNILSWEKLYAKNNFPCFFSLPRYALQKSRWLEVNAYRLQRIFERNSKWTIHSSDKPVQMLLSVYFIFFFIGLKIFIPSSQLPSEKSKYIFRFFQNIFSMLLRKISDNWLHTHIEWIGVFCVCICGCVANVWTVIMVCFTVKCLSLSKHCTWLF